MIRIAVCDDEPVMCSFLNKKISSLLKTAGEPFSIACYSSSSELLGSSAAYDLIFLDIRMPGFDGIDTARQLRERLPDVLLVFVTILKDHMPQAFEVEAFDYLCKPVRTEHLSRTLRRALKRLKRQTEPRLLIRTLNQFHSIRLSSLFYCEVIDRKIYLHTDNGVIDYYGKMEELEKQLDSRFFRCHRSYLVNLDYLKEYSKGQILLENGNIVPVSRLRRREFMDLMLQYMKGADT